MGLKSHTHTVHVVVVPYPSQGHINPLLQFAKRLASKGVKATIATTKYTLHSISASNVAVEPISDGFDDSGFAQAKTVHSFLTSFRSHGSRTLSRLVEKFQRSAYPVTCIVYDSFLPWALEVAKRHGVYGATFFTNSAAVCSMFCRIQRGMLELPVKKEEVPLVVPGLPPLEWEDLPSFVRAPESYPAYLAMKLSQFSNVDKADWMFVNTFQPLETEVVKHISEILPVKLIGPMVPSAYLDGRISGDKGYGANLWKPLSEQCVKWLESKPRHSVVYVSFGSMVSLTVQQTHELARALHESGRNFLWVLRESENAKLPPSFTESVTPRGMVVTWCNQLELLAHESVGCFVSHCGWNSTLEGLSLGVPMVGMPQWADQLTDAKFVEGVWGVGVRAKEGESGVVRKEEIVRCLEEVMEGERSEEMRRNAATWREFGREAMDEGGSSDANIDEFVSGLRMIKSTTDHECYDYTSYNNSNGFSINNGCSFLGFGSETGQSVEG